ncbi:MAG: nitrilase family protein [Muribaculaceae bacterium]|nr:nitrilase family protein [Muribaculaceae bacterium]
MNRLTDRFRVSVLPLAIEWADKKANLKAVEEAFRQLPEGTDLVVLPELFSTGYSDDPDLMRELAERNTGATIDFIRRLSGDYGVAVAGSFLASTPPHIYNRAFFIEPSGEETYYDKRHLFSLSSEAKIMRRGSDAPKVVRFRGWNIAMIVCYDLRFPVWCRVRRNHYDMLVVPANWPKARGYAWEHLLIARAIENQCCVVGADRGGKDFYGDYEGLSRVYDSRGMSVGETSGMFVTAELSRSRQDDFRRSFPVSDDADDFRVVDSVKA